MENITPVIVNGMWVGLILYATQKYQYQFKAVLDALVLRIRSGSEFKVGPVQIGAHIQPQTIEEQSRKLGEEIEVAIPTDASAGRGEVSPDRLFSALEAEDLAFRALQSETSEIIQRNVRVNLVPVDGLVNHENGGLYIYEVKFFQGLPTDRVLVGQYHQVSRLLQKIAPHEKRDLGRIIGVCVIVIDGAPDPTPANVLLQLAASQKHPVEIRVFFLSELRSLLSDQHY